MFQGNIINILGLMPGFSITATKSSSSLHFCSGSFQPWGKPRRPWRTSVYLWWSYRKEPENFISTWVTSATASTAHSMTPGVMTRNRTPPRPSFAAASASPCPSCRLVQISPGYKTNYYTIWEYTVIWGEQQSEWLYFTFKYSTIKTLCSWTQHKQALLAFIMSDVMYWHFKV